MFYEKYKDIKKLFNCEDRPLTHRDKTLNEQFQDYLKSLERDIAKEIFRDIINHSYNNPLENNIFINIDEWHNIVKKYTGEDKR